MLFDLRGKRRRVVQASYLALAVIFLVGFVGFSIGSGNAPGGIFDALGLGGDSQGGSLSSQYDDRIDAANQQLERNPKDTEALLKLAENESLKGKQGVTQDPSTGQLSVSDDAHTELGKAADAWERYLKLNKGTPDAGVAGEMVNTYVFLNDAEGAAQAQRIVTEDRPSSGSYGQLAFFLYYAERISEADAARKKALSLANTATERSTITGRLDPLRKQVLKAKKQQAKAQKNAPPPTTPGANPLESPLGGSGP